jgi:hypothetical protein
MPSDGVRDIPDVSLFAANGVWGHYYPFCDSDGGGCTGTPDNWYGAGGTSFSSPIMAGIQALVNQYAGGPQGNPNPIYYQLAATQYGASGDTACNSTLGNTAGSSCIFYDVTQGDMDVNCTGTYDCYLPSGTYGVLSTSDSAYDMAYGTTTGWDFATGIGTVNAANLVNAWPVTIPPTTTALTASASTIVSGASVTFTATVTGASPTGTVTFYNGAQTPTDILGTGTLSAGVATLATTGVVTVPSDSITAVYGGDANNQGSTSNALTETVSAATFTMPAGSATPATQTISSGGTATITITVTPQGSYTSPISFAATLSPTSNATLTFNPSTVTPNGSAATTTLTITGANASAIAKSLRAANGSAPARNGMKLSALSAFALWTPIGLAGVFLLGRRKKGDWRVARQFLLAAALVVIALTMFGCGSSSKTYQVQITATSAGDVNNGQVTQTTTVAFTVQ